MLHKNKDWQVAKNFREAVENIFKINKTIKNNKSQSYLDGIHFVNDSKGNIIGAKLCPTCSKDRFSGFFCTLF